MVIETKEVAVETVRGQRSLDVFNVPAALADGLHME